jgi:hypothetical protein
LRRINRLIRDIEHNGYQTTGAPEPPSGGCAAADRTLTSAPGAWIDPSAAVWCTEPGYDSVI